ncbi:MarR family transcriptional regulator [Metabacillus fastidiosus]|uniref:MarR family winged helix-turn-helix transcriptional regulator n=1 Tax=Metabacillus fastidiosus TaxID=1458 RepID=UPI002DB6A1C8|nr:MarR family transcriptional regulator [Metabacillus fastidiosus]MEC2078758.1 MarR family transcriptional regulator [Metabacillus fastidiosus]
MDEKKVKNLIDRYLDLSMSVQRRGETIIKCRLGDELTNDQHFILRHIRKTNLCTSTELAEVFEVNKSAITAIINRLMEKGLINRKRDENDRRIVYLTLSELGNELFLESEEKIGRFVEEIMVQFEHEEIEAFLNTYEKLNNALLNYKMGD